MLAIIGGNGIVCDAIYNKEAYVHLEEKISSHADERAIG